MVLYVHTVREAGDEVTGYFMEDTDVHTLAKAAALSRDRGKIEYLSINE